MNYRRATIFLVFLVQMIGIIKGYTQSDMYQKEANMIEWIHEFRNAEMMTRYDSLLPLLRKRFYDMLSDTATIDYSFDSLSNFITMSQSEDQRLRIYSWDNLGGGSYHDMSTLVQYTVDGNLHLRWLDQWGEDNPHGIVDALQYEINDVVIGDQLYYMTLGWGTYGGGQHHKSILFFYFDEGELRICDHCIEAESKVISASRVDKIDLDYNPETKTITHDLFIMDNNIGFYGRSVGTVTLRLVDGCFMRRN